MKTGPRAARNASPNGGRRRSTLILSGLGICHPQQATLEVLKALKDCDVVFNNLPGEESMEFLTLFCKEVRTVSYEGGQEHVWVEKIFSEMGEGRTAAFVTRGHPLISGHLAYFLLERAQREGVAVRSYAAISTVDTILALSEQILGETHWSLQVYDGRLLAQGKAVPRPEVPMIVYLGETKDTPESTARLVDEVDRALAARYPKDHPVFMVERYDKEELEKLELQGLAARLKRVNANMFSSVILMVPPTKSLEPLFARDPDRRAGAPVP